LNAYSPVGDSLSFALGDCLCLSGVCPGYYIPVGASINDTTGELTWCNPMLGIWNFSIRITTYNKVIISGHPTQVPVDTEEVELQVDIDSTCATGIQNISYDNSIKVYPNPNGGVFTLEVNSEERIVNSMVEIYNVLGQRIYSQLSIVNYPLSINISTQPSGIYLWRIITDDGALVGEGKLIIVK
jgi:hypothetical protein